MSKVTESESRYQYIDKMSTKQLLTNINSEDKTVADAVNKCIPAIETLVDKIHDRMTKGGRLFYLGAGTSGRLGIVDASECPPTFGVPHDLIVGLIAGGDSAIRKAVEFAEDDRSLGWEDLNKWEVGANDSVIGIAASGSTPYVIGAIEKCNENGILTGCITCNPDSQLATTANFPICCVVGPEFISGSTRMKAGTAQKLILNMISTSLMVKLGRIEGNRMVDMQLSNNKLVDRGTKMIMEKLNLDYSSAKKLLEEYGSVRKAINSQNQA